MCDNDEGTRKMLRRNLRVVLGLVVGLAAVTSSQFALAEEAKKDVPAANSPTSALSGEDAPLDVLTDEASQALEALRRELPAEAEARVMLEDIVLGHRLGPEDGWFRVALSQNRFDWAAVAHRYDKNADGQIKQDEFPGSTDDFGRLDRDHDGAITERDLSWKDHSLTTSSGSLLFRLADRDVNGKVDRDEFAGLFAKLDADGSGILALDELREQLVEPAGASTENRPDRPSRSTLILGLARQEIGSLQPGPSLNSQAPDFTLPALDGTPVHLSAEIGDKPIVLIFGNFTCGPFRSHSGNLERLHKQYGDRAKFFLVYVREAHPSDGWWSLNNRRFGIDLSQPTSTEERQAVAGQCQKHLQLEIPFLVDNIDDAVGALYSGMPNRFYLIDGQGNVAFKSGRGPFGFKPGELEQALIWLLAESGTKS
jgi:thiol-disulfide isomerase/thioredoxin